MGEEEAERGIIRVVKAEAEVEAQVEIAIAEGNIEMVVAFDDHAVGPEIEAKTGEMTIMEEGVAT